MCHVDPSNTTVVRKAQLSAVWMTGLSRCLVHVMPSLEKAYPINNPPLGGVWSMPPTYHMW